MLNPAQVKENRSQDLLRSLKTDLRDLGAMAELITRGKGRIPSMEDGPLARQTVLAAHRRRKVKARTALKNQVLATMDLVFPGLDGCFTDTFNTKFGRLLVNEAMTPKRVLHMGPTRLRSFAQRRGVMVGRPKAEQILEAARLAFNLPATRADALIEVLVADVVLLEQLEQTIGATESALADVLPSTQAAVLTSIPHVGVVRASNYGSAVGNPTRFESASQIYRMSGLVPRLYESAGHRRAGTSISREGKVELREAILDLGKALRHGHPDFKNYAMQFKGAWKARRGDHVRSRQQSKPCCLRHDARPVTFRCGDVAKKKRTDPSWPTRIDQADVIRPHTTCSHR